MRLSSDHRSVLLIAGCLLSSVALNHPSPAHHRTGTATPNSDHYRIAQAVRERLTLGYERTLSVLYWFDVISTFGGRNAQEADYNELAARLDTITTLNPFAEHAYLMAALVLPWELGETTLSRPLLQKAMRSMPEKWRWPYYYGFNAYWFDHDMKSAARYMARAAALPDAPAIVIRLAGKMRAESNSLDAAIEFLQQLLEKKKDDSLKEMLRQRIATIKTEKILRRIEQRLSAVPEWNGDVAKLRDMGIQIPSILPDGGVVVFDKRHRPISSNQPRRFKIFIPPRIKRKREAQE